MLAVSVSPGTWGQVRGVLGGGPPAPGAYFTFRDAPFGSEEDDATIKMALSPKPSPARRSLESSPAASPVGAATGDTEVKTDETGLGSEGTASTAGATALVPMVAVEPTNAGQTPAGGDGAAGGGTVFGSPARKLGPTSVFTKSVIFRDVNAAITSEANADRQFGNPVDVFLDHLHGYGDVLVFLCVCLCLLYICCMCVSVCVCMYVCVCVSVFLFFR